MADEQEQEQGLSREQLKKHFDEVDMDNDGSLTLDELMTAARLAGQNPTKKELKEMYMDTMDENRDQLISFEEFYDCMCKAGDPKAELECAFKLYDTNGDKKVDAEELKAVLCQGDGIDEDDVEAIIEQFDKDGDNKLDINEFIDFMMQ